jgi:ATP-dependent DNA ligase
VLDFVDPAGPGRRLFYGFRILAELTPGGVKLITRKGFDLASRFPLAAAAIAALPAGSCIIDSEAIACDANGLSVFDLLRYRRQDNAVTLCAFDLLELDGMDLRFEPIEVRKRTLSRPLRRKHAGTSSSSKDWMLIQPATWPAWRRWKQNTPVPLSN